jgi:pimeloyl-ACP methyl ester carboxylesterase
VPDPLTAEPVRVLLSTRTLGMTVRLMSYSDLYTALLPLAIQQASEGDYAMLASHYLMLSGMLDESLGMGMYFSVLCAEDVPLLPESPGDAPVYFDPRYELLRAACAAWQDGPAPQATQPAGALKADTPTLLISGEADPVTPPENGARVAELLTNSAHIIAPGLGHSNFYIGCIPNLVLDFLDAASPSGLDTSCVETIQPMPFFLSPSGPNP